MIGSFPNANPHAPEAFARMMVEHVAAADGLTEVALESACREIVEEQKFAPAVAEVMKVLDQHIMRWRDRKSALQRAESTRLELINVLIEREQEKKEAEHKREFQQAINQTRIAMQVTQRLAREVEAMKTELAALVQRHAEAEKRESECMRALRKCSAMEEEHQAQAAAKANGFGCGEFRFVPGDSSRSVH